MPEKNARIILASSSPRRAELLNGLGVEFEQTPSLVPERLHVGEAPPDYIIRLARAKVIAAARRWDAGLVIGADTIVVVDGRILEKPEDEEDAARLLRQLSGRWHAVMTGLALYDISSGREVADFDKTLVRFSPLTEKEIRWYINTGEPMDKAGGYGIQGKGGLFVEEIAGNYFNVVGLPIPLLYRLARRLGYLLIE